MAKFKIRRKRNKNENIDIKEYKVGYSQAKFKARMISKPIKSTVTTLPGLTTQNLIGTPNKLITVSSMGEESYSTGYHTAQQLLRPTVQTAVPIGFINKAPLRGVQGGPKVVENYFYFDKFHSIYGTVDTSSTSQGNIPQGVSIDTLGYLLPLKEMIAMARKTSATYQPVLNMTIPSNTDTKKYHVKWGMNQISGNIHEFDPTSPLVPQALANALTMSKADLATMLFILQAGHDYSKLAYDLQMFIDICFNNYDKYAQVFFNHRNTVRAIAAETKKSAISKPVMLLAQILKSIDAKLIYGPFYNQSDYMMSRVQSRTSSSTSPIEISYFRYNIIESFWYVLGSGIPQESTLFPSIFDNDNNMLTSDQYQVNGSTSYKCFGYKDPSFKQFFDAIVTDNVNQAVTFITNIVKKISDITPTVSTKYIDVKTLTTESGIDLGLKNTELPLEIKNDGISDTWTNYRSTIQSLGFTSYIQSVSSSNSSWVTIPDYITTSFDTTYRVPIRWDGSYPTIMNTDMFPMNIPAIHTAEYAASWPSGLIFTRFNVFNAAMDEYTNIYTVSSGSYLNDYSKFLDFLVNHTISSSYTVQSDGVSVTLTCRDKSIMLDDLILVTPKIDRVYMYGLTNSPINQSKRELFIK